MDSAICLSTTVDEFSRFMDFSFTFHFGLCVGDLLSCSSQAIFIPIKLSLWIKPVKALQPIAMIKKGF